MACDIHSHVEVYKHHEWQQVEGDIFPLPDFTAPYVEGAIYDYTDEPFFWRSYDLFAWLADVRNYAQAPVLAQPRGLPTDISVAVRYESDIWGYNAHSHSYLTLTELLAADYEQAFMDHRANEITTLREFLGKNYFIVLDVLQTLSANTDEVRIVFWFDC